MKVITRNELERLITHPEFSWLSRDSTPARPWIFEASPHLIHFNFEENSPLTKDDLDLLCPDLRNLFHGYSKAYLRITEPEFLVQEGTALVTVIRRGFGETRPLKTADTHIFDSDDADLLWGLFVLMVQLSWSFMLTFPDYPCGIGYSLPGNYYFVTWKRADLFERAKAILKGFHPAVA